MNDDFLTDGDDDNSYAQHEHPGHYEPLRPELHRYLVKQGIGFMIRHPFCYNPVENVNDCSDIHRLIDGRAAIADECFEAQNWEGFLFHVDAFLKPEWFAKDKDLYPDDRYWAILSEMYRRHPDSDTHRHLFRDFFTANRLGREAVMTDTELNVFRRLPKSFAVYRGIADRDGEDGVTDGLSWTLDRKMAVFTANTPECQNPRVISGRISREHVWAYLENFYNLVLPPEKVFHRRISPALNRSARRTMHPVNRRKPFDIEAWLRKANGAE